MTPNKTGGLLAALAIFSLSAFAQSNAGSNSNPAKHPSRQETYRVYNDDSSGNREEQLAAYMDEHHYKVHKVNGKITELYVDGRKIAADSLKEFETAIAALEEQIGKDKEENRKDQARAWKDRQQAEMDRESYRKDWLHAEMDKRQAESDLRHAEMDQRGAVTDLQLEERHILLAEKYEQLAKEYAWKARMEYIKARSGNRRSVVAYKHREDEVAEEGARKMRADRQMMRGLIRDLVKDNIIGSEKDLIWMALTDDKLIVNGKMQPKSVHEKFRSKYISKPGYGIFYGDSQVQGTGLFLNKQDLDKADL